MQDRRESVRDKVFLGGVAEINTRGSTMDCVVRNFSETGACVEFDSSARIPDEMNLTISQRGRSYLRPTVSASPSVPWSPTSPRATSMRACAAARRRSASFNARSISCSATAEPPPRRQRLLAEAAPIP
jgi:hypothetical protein